jgi:glycosyltransferase involved in cell wall biosynthesis
MPNLSAVVITLNEELNIARCLESLSGVASEIVVVDSLSTDRTEEICRRYGVKFIKQPFLGYIEQKNFALAQATFDHILSLDADEALSPELRDSILSLGEEWPADGYYFNRLTSYCGRYIRHGGWYPDRKLRLFDRTKGSWQGMNPHDKFVLEPGCIKAFLKGDLLHYSFYTIDQHITQINKFSGIKAEVLFNAGKRAGFLKMSLSPCLKFLKTYFFKLGFLDGFYGYVISRNSAHSTFLKYAKLRALHKRKNLSPEP